MSTAHETGRRRDIDGLRAIAVLAVIAFHAVPALLPGGFTGVDVFFVISGFVITQVLDNDLERGQFSFLEFYHRRVRRIIPPLLALSAVTLAVFFVLFTPFNFKKLGQSALASSLFWANRYFCSQAGYFAGPVRERPLLHTWSLSVEEQFYMVWPAMMWLGHRKLKRPALVAGVTVIVVVSLLWSEHLVRTLPDNAFFSTFSRAWELGLGALGALAQRHIHKIEDNGRVRAVLRALPTAGALLVLYGLAFTKNTAFPGVHALPACIGTLLIIVAPGLSAASPQNPVSAILASRVAVYVGRLSYSLYLWHWPIFCAAFLVAGNAPAPSTLVCCVLATVLFAMASYHLLEVPLRQRNRDGGFVIPAGRVLPACAVGGMAIVFTGFAAHRTEGFARNVQASNVERLVRNDALMRATPECRPLDSRPVCAYDAGSSSNKGLLVWGDSHASVIGRALRLAGLGRRFRILIASKGACPPALGYRVVSQGGVPQSDCEAFNREVSKFAHETELAAVVISARWSLYEPTDVIADRPVGSFYLAAGDGRLDETRVSVLEGVKAAISAGLPPRVPVLVIGQPPEFLLGARNCALSRYASRLMDGRCDLAESKLASWSGVRAGLNSLEVPSTRVRFLDLLPDFCVASTCSAIDRGTGDLLYEDDNHINAAGGARIADQLSTTLNQLVQATTSPTAVRN